MTTDPQPDPHPHPEPHPEPHPHPLDPALAAAEAAGWAVVRLDLDGVRTKARLMDVCAEAFGLPEWFGRNWDALADCLRDPAWLPGGPGRLVVVTGWRGLGEALPGDWEVLREVLEEASAHWREVEGGPPLEVVVAAGRA
ncbi:barstar family protein [Streptomyces sp. NPDC007369]|uniref:barstar family protein n=1 Tax=Streptomyces sp. NPDC007369 TaxID=3154589 RepID=UPI0033C76E0B